MTQIKHCCNEGVLGKKRMNSESDRQVLMYFWNSLALGSGRQSNAVAM